MFKNTNYFSVMEEKDAAIMQAFNDDLKYFEKLNFTEPTTRHDATAIDIKGRKVHLEVKNRQGKYKDFNDFVKKYDTMYVGADKLGWMEKIMESGMTLNEKCLFVTIFNDGDYVLLFNPFKRDAEIIIKPMMRTWNPGKQQWTFETNIGIRIKDCLIYRKGGDNHYRQLTRNEVDSLS